MTADNQREISAEELLKWERLADEAGFLKLDDESTELELNLDEGGDTASEAASDGGADNLGDEHYDHSELNGQAIGAYRLTRKIGQGGSGVVFEAWQMAPLHRKVAVKLLNTDFRYGEKRWQAEVQALAALKHPGIVQIYEAGVTESGSRYLVMPLIEGLRIDAWSGVGSIEAMPTQADLADQESLDTSPASNGPDGSKPAAAPTPQATIRPATSFDSQSSAAAKAGPKTKRVAASASVPSKSSHDIAAVMLEVAKAIAYAHSTGILHRDLKPSNILVSAGGKPTITDFGLAKHLESPAYHCVTTSGMLIGSLGFMAPEQLNWSSDHSGPAIDIYGLGATLYFLLTGQLVVRTQSFAQAVDDLANRHPASVREFNRQVPRDLDAICLKCLEKSPSDRYQSMEDLADDLHRFLHGLPVSVVPISYLGRFKRWCRREPVLAAIVFLVPILLAITASAFAWLWQRSEFNRVRMQQNLELAVDILRDELTVAEAHLPNVKGSLDYRLQRQKAAIGFLEKLHADNPENESIQRRLAVAQYLLGMLPKTEGRLQERYDAFQAALAGFSKLAEDNPQDLSLQFDIFHTLLGLSNCQSDLGLPEAREASLEEGLLRMEAIVAAEPDNPDYQDALAFILTQVARKYWDYEKTGPNKKIGHALCGRAIEIATSLTNEFPDRPNFIRHIIGGNIVHNLLATHEEDYPSAIQYAKEALRFAKILLERVPGDPTNLELVINSNTQLARTLVLAGQLTEALKYHTESLALAEQLVEAYPDHSPFRQIRDTLQPNFDELLQTVNAADSK
jgi:serine/threonine protein kinase